MGDEHTMQNIYDILLNCILEIYLISQCHPNNFNITKRIIASEEAQNPKRAYSKFTARRGLGAEPIIKDV